MTDATEQLRQEVAAQRGDIKELTVSINKLATAIAEKEIHDHHMAEKQKGMEGRINNHADRIKTIEAALAGISARKEIVDWVVKPLITIAISVMIGGAFYGFVLSKGAGG